MTTARYAINLDEVEAVITILQDALINRPNPEGRPRSDISITYDILEDFTKTIKAIIDDSGKRDTNFLLSAAEDLRDVYWRLWERPFPPGLEMGQPLLSMVLERPMRDLLGFLTSLVADGAEEDVSNRQLTLDSEEEMQILQQWLDGLSVNYYRAPRSTKRYGIFALIASFFLGSWLGGDSDQ